MADYIPKAIIEYYVWQFNLIGILTENAAAWGIPEEVITSIKAKQARWKATYDKASNKQNRTAADVIDRNQAGVVFTKEIRNVVQLWLSRNPKVSDADRLRLGISVRSKTHTPVPPPFTAPMGIVDCSRRLQHTISFYDEASAHSNARPAGVTGCEIYVKADGEAPKNLEEMHFQGTCTASPYVVTFDSAKAGKTAWYWLRWVNGKGEPGPWSIMVSAMILG